MKQGIDYIGGMNYLDVIKKHHPGGWYGGSLVRASGWEGGLVVVKTLCDLDCPGQRTSGIWHDNHRFTKRDIKPATKIAARLAKVVEANQQVKWWAFSPWLEPGTHQSPIDKKLMNQCLRACREELPRKVKLVDGSHQLRRRWREFHGYDVIMLGGGKTIYSYDGTDALRVGSGLMRTAKRQGAKVGFYWCAQCNGKVYATEATPRPNRTHWLTAGHIKRIEQLSREV